MAVIIPCAGRSSRYPGTRPKYLLTLYDGSLMFETAARPYIGKTDVHFVILQEHEKKYNVKDTFSRVYGEQAGVHVHVLEDETSGPAETVYTITKQLPPNESVFVKDCDSFFDAPMRTDNHVCVADLRENLNVTKVAAKSFAVANNQNMLTGIVEKSVASNYICVGGYGFSSAGQYNGAFEKLQTMTDEIFVSHVIQEILHTDVFEILLVNNYIDVGTYQEFVEYNQSKPTIFCDLDGTVFYNQSEHFDNHHGNPPKPIPNAVKYLLDKQANGCRLIFTTSRKRKFADVTVQALKECGFQEYDILFDMPHAPRMIINDNSVTNPYPTAIALNVPRDDDEYWKKIS